MSLFGKTVSKALPQIINVALTLLGTTIGELIAKAIDYADKWWGIREIMVTFLIRIELIKGDYFEKVFK